MRPTFRAVLGLATLLATGIAASGIARADDAGPSLRIVSATPRVGIGDTLTVQFEHLDDWTQVDPHSDPLQAMLFIDGYPVRGVKPDRRGDQLAFHLLRADAPDARETWAEIVHGIGGFSRMMSLGIGLPDGRILTWGPPIEFAIIPSDTRAILGLMLLLVAVVALVVLARRTNILRDPGIPAADTTRRSFSLARSQMALWFVVILLSYLYLWVVTGERDTLPTSVIALLGISSATALGAVVADDPKNKAAREEITKVQADHTLALSRASVLREQLASLTAPADAELRKKCADDLLEAEYKVAALQNRLRELSSRFEASGNFLLDVLSDDRGVSLSRFQMLIWTTVLGIVFIVSVRTDLAMPDLSGTLLALMGVSSGTYIGLKLPEGSS